MKNIFKRVLSFTLAMIMILSLSVTTVIADLIPFTVSQSEVKAGDEFTVKFVQPSTQSISGLTLKITFDKNAFTLTKYEAPYKDMSPSLDGCNTAGEISIGYSDSTLDANTAISAKAALLTLTFKVKNDATTGSKTFAATFEETGAYDEESFGYPTIDFGIPADLMSISTKVIIPATGVEIKDGDNAATDFELYVGDTKTLSAELTPSNATSAVVWSSSNDDVASVDSSSGEVTAVAEGSATITATSGSVSDTVNVTVSKKTLTISLSKTEDFVVIGHDATVSASITDAPEDAPSLEYAITAGSDYATLTGNTLTAGTTQDKNVTVTVSLAASDKYKADSVSEVFHVIGKEPNEISVNNVTGTYGDTGKSVSATLTKGDGTISYAVKEGSTDIIDVNASTGALTFKKAGTAYVIVTASETTDYAKATEEVTVTVSKKAITLNVTPTSINPLRVGNEKEISASITTSMESGKEATPTFAITAGSSYVSFDNSTKKAKGVAEGSATIKVTAENDYYAATPVEISVTVANKLEQTISVSNYTEATNTVTAGTVGGATIAVSANTDNTEQGKGITYAYKKVASTDDYFTINETTGAITNITKAGDNAKATVVITAAETENYAKATKEVLVLINKGSQTAPSTPNVDSSKTTSDSITIVAPAVRSGSYTLQYMLLDHAYGLGDVLDFKDEGNDGTYTFTGLDANKTYYLYARKKGTDTLNSSPMSGSVTETTKKLTQTISATTTTKNVRINSSFDLKNIVSTDATGNTLSFALKQGSSYPNGTSMTTAGVINTGNNASTNPFIIVVSAGEYENYAAATDVEITVNVIVKEVQEISADDVEGTYGDTDKKVSASITTAAAITDGATVSYAVKTGSEDYISVNSSTGALTFKKAGTAYVIATASETDNYAEATKEIKVTIKKKAITLNVTPTTINPLRVGNMKEISATITTSMDSGKEATPAFEITAGDTNVSFNNTTKKVLGLAAGSATIKVTAENDCYVATPVTVSITVAEKLDQTIFNSSDPMNITYGDTNKTISKVVAESATVTFAVKSGSDVVDVNATTGVITTKKVGTAVITATSAETENYKVTAKDITVNVGKRTVAIQWNNYSASRVYDGNPSNITATITNKVGSDDVSLNVTGGAETDAGSYTAVASLEGNAIDNYQLPTESSKNYTITKVVPNVPTFSEVKEDMTIADVSVDYDTDHYVFSWKVDESTLIERGEYYGWELKAKPDFAKNYSDREGTVRLLGRNPSENPIIVGKKGESEYNPNTGAEAAVSLAAFAAVLSGAYILISKKH